jgi:hypothetical protein
MYRQHRAPRSLESGSASRGPTQKTDVRSGFEGERTAKPGSLILKAVF